MSPFFEGVLTAALLAIFLSGMIACVSIWLDAWREWRRSRDKLPPR